MKCGEARESLFAYLDGELDVRLSMQMQCHLDACHDCAREAKIEWEIKGCLRQALRPATGLAFDEKALEQILGPERVAGRRGRNTRH
ncbi:MAG: zf-HC2 domain-containing protein [Planctomycetes bacterium]|nr:zf-HC2 domain-containing protein [Planctomycetota bacterium]